MDFWEDGINWIALSKLLSADTWDMYSPEYAIEDLIEKLKKLATQGKLPKSVKTYLHETWKEIEEMESCIDYGVPRRELPF